MMDRLRWSTLLVIAAIFSACGDHGGSQGAVGPTPDGRQVLEMTFGDSALVAALGEMVPTGDSAQASTWLDTVTRISLPGAGITRLDGVAALVRTRVLDLSDNGIQDIAPLAALDSLEFLDLAGNRVNDLSPLERLGRLSFLSLAGNRISDISVLTRMAGLSAVELTGNPLGSGQDRNVEALLTAGVQVDIDQGAEPLPPAEAPNFGVSTYAFLGRATPSSRANIWLGSTDGQMARDFLEEIADFSSPVWSPDGTQLVFSSNREDALRQFRKIYSAGIDGSGLVAISDWSVGTPVAWAPDGSRIAVVQRHGNISADILVMAPDGGDLRQLTDPFEAMDGVEGDLSWAPDGRRIAFMRRSGSRLDGQFLHAVHPDSAGLIVLDVDTGTPRRLVSGDVSDVRWSPTSEEILFVADGDVMVVDAVGGAVTNLTQHVASNSQPAWSPDGRQIVFVSNRDNAGVYYGDLFVMGADGSEVKRLTAGEGQFRAPSWSPDGLVIAYLSDASGIWSIHLTDPEGQFHLNTTAGEPKVAPYTTYISWQPK